MDWRAVLGRELSIFRGDELLPPAPSRSAEALLVALLAHESEWLSRALAAGRLYPHASAQAARAALRQTLHRLQLWLGTGSIMATTEYLRLSQGWSCELAPGAGQHVLASVEHEWVENLRQRWLPAHHVPWPHTEFADLVRATAQIDADEARAILIGGRTMLWQLSAEEAHALLDLTRPTDPVVAGEALYELLVALYHYGTCQLDSAMSMTDTALQHALQDRQYSDAMKVAGLAFFAAAESGDDRVFSKWRAQVLSLGKEDLLIRHGMAAYLWNAGDTETALQRFKALREEAISAGRNDRLHYWTNYFVLCAENGLVELARTAREMCDAEELGAKDERWMDVITLGDAHLHIAVGQDAAAIEKLGGLHSRGWHIVDVYRKECLALALAHSGRAAEARLAWRTSRSLMQRGGMRPNKRRQRLAQRLRALLP